MGAATHKGELVEQHASLVVAYVENSFVAAAAEVVVEIAAAEVAEIEVVGAPFDVAQLMQRRYCN